MKLTPWYPSNVFPVRPGWYDCKHCTEAQRPMSRHWWNGARWIWRPLSEFYIPAAIEWRGIEK